MKRKNILLLLAALSSIGFCYGQAPVRILDLADYPVQLVDFDDMEISFQRVAPDCNTNRRQIAEELYCVFQMAYTVKASDPEIRSDEYFGTVSLFKGSELLLKADSIGMVGPFEYSETHGKLVIAFILDQNQDSLDTDVDLYLVDLRNKTSRKINDEQLLNCEYGCMTEDGKFVLYGSAGKLYKYDIEKQNSECILDFYNSTLFIFKLSYRNNTLAVFSYDNYFEDVLSPIHMHIIPNIAL